MNVVGNDVDELVDGVVQLLPLCHGLHSIDHLDV